MGYFANLYFIEAVQVENDAVEIITSIYKGDSADTPYFSWISGERPNELHSHAYETIFSDVRLKLLSGYPVKNKQKLGEKMGIDSSIF